MPSGLHRTYGAHHLHFITCSCYRRLPFLGSARSRDRFLSILEQTRQRYRFVVVGYVVMPEHIHLLMTEPEVGTPSTVMQVRKQRTARALLPKKKRADARQQLYSRERHSAYAFLASALLRLQRLDDAKAGGETAVYASQSGEARTGGLLRNNGAGAVIGFISLARPARCAWMKAGPKFHFEHRHRERSSLPRHFSTPPLQKTQGRAPTVLLVLTNQRLRHRPRQRERSPLRRQFRLPPLQKTQGRGTRCIAGVNEIKGWAIRLPFDGVIRIEGKMLHLLERVFTMLNMKEQGAWGLQKC